MQVVDSSRVAPILAKYEYLTYPELILLCFPMNWMNSRFLHIPLLKHHSIETAANTGMCFGAMLVQWLVLISLVH